MATKDPNQIKLETEIIRTKSDIDVALLEASEDDFTPQIRELRDRVFLAHSSIDSSMDFDIFQKVLISATPGAPGSRRVRRIEFNAFFDAFDPIQKGMTFIRKLQILKNLNVFSSELFQVLTQLNQLRVEFAHPKEKEYQKYESQIEYKKALEIVLKSLQMTKNEEGKIEPWLIESAKSPS
jgi:hypothetical protein